MSFESSFHKKSTRNFLLKLIREEWGFAESEVVAEMRFDIPKSYNFHKAKTKDVEVDLIRIFVGGDNNVDGDKNAESKDSTESLEGSEMDVENKAAEESLPPDGGDGNEEDIDTLS